jgi:hypothetical protein
MPRNSHPGRLLSRLFFLSLLGYAFASLRGDGSPTRASTDERSFSPPLEPADPRPKPAKRHSRPRRIALGTVMTLVFFAGAAFTAGAGNQIASALDTTQSQSSDAPSATAAGGETSDSAPASDPAAAPTGAPAPDAAAPTADPNAAPAAAPDATPATPDSSASPDSSAAPTSASDSSSSSEGDAVAGSGSGASAQASAPAAGASVPTNAAPTQSAAPTAPVTAHAKKARVQLPYVLPKQRPSRPAPRKRNPTRAPVVRASARQEASESPNLAPVVWLNRVLPDPTPPARRLDARFAKRLGLIARQSHVDWALMLGVLRAQGASSSVPATPGQLRALAAQLAAYRDRDAWNAVLAVTGLTSTADQAVALEHYDRAVGLRALVDGLQAHYDDLVAKVLNDGRITIYPGGRNDLASKRVNIRVVVLMEYLAETFGQETVSCLLSGHRLYARPGVVSAHIYGLAVDVADLGGVSIYGHQEPGGLTEKAVRSILLLPAELQPKQVISLLGLGGPSFPLADHFDHIHVGY